MSFFADLFGGASGKRAANDAAAAQAGYINSGYDKAETASNAGYDRANGYISPYIESGRQASKTYNNALGLNGQAGYADAMGTYNAFAAPEQEATRNALSNQFRQYNAGRTGGGFSGGAMLASGRVAADRYAQSRNNWLGLINGQQQQGWQASQTGANLASQQGNQQADYAIGRNTGLANTEAQRIQNNYQAQQGGVNNMFKAAGMVGGLALSAFAPGAGGMSAAGNMASMFGGGGGSGGGGLPWQANTQNALSRGWQ